MEDKYNKHKEICDSINKLYIAKNKEYGDSFGEAYREMGAGSSVMQIYHKSKRLFNTYKKDKNDIKFESVEDTLMDLANYTIMLLVEMELDK